MSDALQVLVENSTHVATLNGVIDYGKVINIRYTDLVSRKNEVPQEQEDITETMSCNEIAAGIWERMRKRGG